MQRRQPRTPAPTDPLAGNDDAVGDVMLDIRIIPPALTISRIARSGWSSATRASQLT